MKIRLTQKLRDAAQRYVDLQSRKTHPRGVFDQAGRWMPHKEQECCKSIRTPSRAWPWSLMVHCRTMRHVAHESGYRLSILQAAVRRVISEHGVVTP